MLSGDNIHCHVGNIAAKADDKRQRSAVVAASYQSGLALFREKSGLTVDARDYGEDDVRHHEIIAPDGAPEWALDRETLWNTVERTAKRKDARLAKKIEVALTREVPEALRLSLLHEFVKPFIQLGCVVDLAIHNDDADHNPHAHIMLTTYQLTADGFGKKISALDPKKFVNDVRKA